MTVARKFGVAAALLGIVLSFSMSLPAKSAGGKEMIVDISWGDQIAFVAASKETPLLTVDSFRKIFEEYQQAGVDTVLFRIDVLRWVREYNWPEPKLIYKNSPPEVLDADQKQWEGSQMAVKQNLLKPVVDLAHQHGMKIYAYSTTFDEGMPLNEVWYADGERGGAGTPNGEPVVHHGPMYGPLISKFCEAHPECVMVDRSQKKYNWGTLEFAYPQARAYAVGYNQWFLENYPFDGIYIDFRNEFSHPEFGDQFGFAPPIVDEYKRRYGVDILHQQFDVEKWRRLCGEYLTQFIEELQAMVRGKGKKLMVGIPQGNYMGLPNGNMYMDWQGWANRHLVDGLIIGVFTGQFIFPDRIGYGYLTDMESNIGLPNLLGDLQNNYWPLCAAQRVKLYVHPTGGGSVFRGPRIPPADYLKTSVDGLFTSFSAVQKLKSQGY